MSLKYPLQPCDERIMVDGLLIVGTHAECGKTIATTGLVGAMLENGLRMQALKPLEFAPPSSLKQTLDQDFMNRVLRPLQRSENMVFESFHEVTPVEWNRLLHSVRAMTYPCMIESPGCYSTSLAFNINKGEILRDVVSLSQDLETPMLLVTEKSPQLLENIRGAIHYLRSRQGQLIGWISVETHEQSFAPFWEEESHFIVHQEQLPYFGNIGYSPSIGVTHGHQGNLIHQTQEGVDLLPIQMGVGTLLP